MTATIALVPTIRATRSARTSAPTVPHWIGRAVVSLRRSSIAWLDRPLGSLHLLLGVFGLLTTFGPVMLHSRTATPSIVAGWPIDRLIRAARREEPDQLLRGDPREPAQLRQLLHREHITGRHQTPRLRARSPR